MENGQRKTKMALGGYQKLLKKYFNAGLKLQGEEMKSARKRAT
jgi:tmRNA-binding protein